MRLALLLAALPLGNAIPPSLPGKSAAESPDKKWPGSPYNPRDVGTHRNPGSATAALRNINRSPSPATPKQNTADPALTTTAGNFRVVILADTNRDGKVDVEGSSDLGEGKETWSDESGALFLPNIGDTSNRCLNLHGHDDTLVKCNDASDDIQRAPEYLAPLRTVPIPGLTSSAVGRISVSDPIARKCVRVFRPSAPSDQCSTQEKVTPELEKLWSIFEKPDNIKESDNGWKIVQEQTTFSAAELAQGLQLGIDARGPRGHLVAQTDSNSEANNAQPWDGRATVQFTVTDGETNFTDSVMLRVAPLVTQNHLQRVTKIFGTKRAEQGGYKPTLDGIEASAKKVGVKGPIQQTGGVTQFIQDLFETMYASIPGPNGTVISLPVILPAPIQRSNSPAALQVAGQIRSTGVGMVTDVLPPGENEETLDSMGNLETIPPYKFNSKNFLAGRIIMGANRTAGRVPLSLPFLQAQEMQDPLLIDTMWLEVQHVDEFLQFLPAKTPRKWRVMVSDPLAALRLVQDVQAGGRGNESYTSRPPSETEPFTALDQILSGELAQTNEECARRIEATLEMLKREIGISDEDILRVPVLYARNTQPASLSNGDFQVNAIYPNAINGLVLTDSLYVAPKQWGPLDASGTDIFQHAVEMVYKEASYNVDFVDDWNFHMRKGDIHCATNVLRELPGYV